MKAFLERFGDGFGLAHRADDLLAQAAGAAEYFQISEEEAVILSQWRLAEEEVPVVLFLADRGGVSPDVVVAQRRDGTGWLPIARTLGIHAGDFHVDLPQNSGGLASVMNEYRSHPTARWHQMDLTDRDVTALVNVRFLSRYLEVSPQEVVAAWGEEGSFVQAFFALGRRAHR